MEGLVGQLLLQGLTLAHVAHVKDEAPHGRELEQVGNRHLGRTVGVVVTTKAALDRDRRSDDVDRLLDLV